MTVADRWVNAVARGVPPGINTTRIGNVDRNGEPLAKMVAPCNLLFSVGASVHNGLLVEFGTWCGASMRCYGAGLNTTGNKGRAHGFDYFAASQLEKLKRTKWYAKSRKAVGNALPAHGSPPPRLVEDPNFSLLEPFYWQTQDVYPSVAAHQGSCRDGRFFESSLPPGMHVDVFADDTAKSAQDLATDLAIAAPRLRVGSLLVLADFLYHITVQDQEPRHNQIHWVFHSLVPEHLTLLGVAGTYAFFGVRRALDAEWIRNAHAEWRSVGARNQAACTAAYGRAQRALLGPPAGAERVGCVAACVGLPVEGTLAATVRKLHKC